MFNNCGVVYDNKLIGSIGLLNPNDNLLEAEAGYCTSKNFGNGNHGGSTL